MRKIVRYASISWEWGHWAKEITWIDPDTHEWRGAKRKEIRGQKFDVFDDNNTMFALRAGTSPSAELHYFTIEPGVQPDRIRIKQGNYVYVGNGFLYWETDNEYKEPESKST